MPRISPEKSSFAQTCNLLSHYLKEKGTLRDLNLGINGQADTSSSGKTAEQASTAQINIKYMNLFSQHASMQGDVISITSSSEEGESEATKGQLTIFYGGQVMVLDDISDGKAKQVMQLAISKSVGSVTPCSGSDESKYPDCHSMCSASGGDDDIKQLQWQPIASDLPIARRASLHRFLSKRKDSARARGPYHVHNKYPSPKEQFDLNL